MLETLSFEILFNLYHISLILFTDIYSALYDIAHCSAFIVSQIKLNRAIQFRLEPGISLPGSLNAPNRFYSRRRAFVACTVEVCAQVLVLGSHRSIGARTVGKLPQALELLPEPPFWSFSMSKTVLRQPVFCLLVQRPDLALPRANYDINAVEGGSVNRCF